MSLLKEVQRVKFNPADPEHRGAVKKFMVRNSWNDAGIKFILQPEYDNLVDQTGSMLINWYFTHDTELK
jgi:hypothetical protein